MNIIVFGPPGAGKGTQAEIIAKEQRLVHLSSGELSRRLLGDKQLGQKIKNYMDAGRLIPNDIIIDIVEKYIIENADERGFVFDGYPRTLGQAEALDRLARKSHTKIHLVINLKLSAAEALERILKRALNSGRSDDNRRTTENRLRIYRERTEPILEYYRQQGKLEEVDGRQKIEKIAKQISQLIKETKKAEALK